MELKASMLPNCLNKFEHDKTTLQENERVKLNNCKVFLVSKITQTITLLNTNFWEAEVVWIFVSQRKYSKLPAENIWWTSMNLHTLKCRKQLNQKLAKNCKQWDPEPTPSKGMKGFRNIRLLFKFKVSALILKLVSKFVEITLNSLNFFSRAKGFILGLTCKSFFYIITLSNRQLVTTSKNAMWIIGKKNCTFS